MSGEATENPELWGPDGVFARFTRAANGIHEVAEKLRAMKNACPHCGQPMPRAIASQEGE